MSTIELTRPEMLQAGITGLARFIEARWNSRTPLNGQSIRAAAGDDILGAMAEAAVAKALRTYWLGEWHNHKALDVGRYQVRHTVYDSGDLLIQPGDDPTQPYILVSGVPPRLKVCGWIMCREAQQEKYWDKEKPRPCYAVPQCDLAKLPELP